MNEVAGFYDDLAPDYHRIFPDWAASVHRQGTALDAVIRAELGQGAPIDDAVRRAWAEAGRRGVSPALAVADMRALPFAAGVSTRSSARTTPWRT
jgi:glycine/sarcosine N-methyltransferase